MAPLQKKVIRKSQETTKVNGSNNKQDDKFVDDINVIQLVAQTFDRLFQSYKRNKVLSSFLFIVYAAQLMSLLLSRDVVNNFYGYYNHDLIEKVSIFLEYFQLFPSILLNYSTVFQIQFSVYVSFGLNMMLVIVFIANCIYFKTTGFSQSLGSLNSSKDKNLIGGLSLIHSYFNLLFCFIIQIYYYILWIPFIDSCFNLVFNKIGTNTISFVLAIFSSVLTVIIVNLSRVFDKNHSFKMKQDLLAQRKNKYKYICIFSEFLIIAVKQLDSLQFYQILHVLISIVRLISLLIELPFFLNKKMDNTMLNLGVFYLFQSILICALGVNKNKSGSEVDYLILSFIMIPITYKISQSLYEYKIKYILNYITSVENIDFKIKQNVLQDINLLKVQQFIYLLNQYNNLVIEDYMKEGNGIIFETLFSNHTKNCLIRKQNKQQQIKNLDKFCFCEKYGINNYEQITRQDMMGGDYRTKFLIGYINYLFDNIYYQRSAKLIKDLEIQCCFTYFQVEIAKTPSKAYSQIIQLQNILQKSNNSFWAQLQIYQLVNAILSDFSGFFNSSEYQNQRLNIHLVFEFEQNYQDLKKVFKSALQNQQRFYEYLNQDTLHLQTLQKIGNSCLQNNRDIEQNLVQMFDIHPTHQRTFSLAELFQEFFDFRRRHARYFASRSKQQLKNKLMKYDTKINLFLKNTCSLFISLSDQKKILRITNTASKFFKFTNSFDLIGKPLPLLQPEWIQDKTQQTINLLQDEGDVHLIKLGEYFTFMRDLKLSIFPVVLRAQMSIISNKQLGLSLFIQKLDNFDKYIVCDSSYKIINCNESFITQYIKQSLQLCYRRDSQDFFKDSDLRHMIPFLLAIKLSEINDVNGLEEYEEQIGFRKIQNSQSQIFSTLFLLPKEIEKLNTSQKFNNNSNPYNIEKYLNELDVLSYNFSVITFSLYKIKDQKNQLNDIIIIEVKKIKQIKRISELNEQLQILQINLQNKFPTYNIKVPTFSQNQILEQKFQQNTQFNLDDQGQNLWKKTFVDFAAKTTTQSEQDKKAFSSLLLTQAEINADEKEFKLQKENNIENLLLQSESRANHQFHLHSNKNLSNINLTINDLPSTKRMLSDHQINLTKQNVSYSFQHLLQPTQQYQESPAFNRKQGLQEENFTALYEPIYLENDSTTNQKSGQLFQNLSKIEKQKSINQIVEYLDNQNNQQENEEGEEEEEEEGAKNASNISDGDQVVNFAMEEEDYSEESSTKEHQKVIDDSCSINSTQSQIFSKRRWLFDMVLKSKKSKETSLAKFIGFASLLIILFVTIFLYFQLNNYLDLESKYFENMLIGKQQKFNSFFQCTSYQKGPELFEDYLQILRGTEIQTIIGVDSLYHFLPASQYGLQDFIFAKNESQTKLSNITTSLGDFQKTLVNNGLEDQLINESSQMINQNILDKSLFNLTFTKIYQLLNLPTNLRQYTLTGTIDARTYIYSNYQSFIDIFTGILETQGNLANDQLDNTKNLIILSFIFYEIACFLSSLIILPLYFIIQQKNENILRLFSTFNADFLKFMIEKYRAAGNLDILNSQNQQNLMKGTSIRSKNEKEQFMQFKSQHKAFNKNNQNQQQNINIISNTNNQQSSMNKKKRQVSKTNQLQKFSIRVSLIALLVFFTISIYSILNYYITQDFFNYFTFNIKELSLVAQTKSQLSLSYTAVNLLYNSYAYNFNQTDVDAILFAVDKFINKEFSEKISSLQQIQQDFSTNSRGFIPNYMEILLDTLNKNACSIFNPEYIKKYSNLSPVNIDENSYQACQESYFAILPQGLIVAMNLALQRFKSLELQFTSTRNNSIAFFYSVAMWDMQNNFKQFDYFYYQVRLIIENLTLFMVNSSKDYISYLQYVQFVLFLYSICVTTAILFFIWNKYVSWIDQSVFKTISLLSLVPIENQLENPYIVSYLNKEKSKMKNK